MAKSRIQLERERRKNDFMNDYDSLMNSGQHTQLKVFEILADRYGYSSFNTARTTYFRWAKEQKENTANV
ncbi:hypothetical protein GO491_11945 [Flavobacteriaceae bacterium Ap0902]|nr:hypothetical protein [Flavobacteriaceae bacterium Ap0902]